MRERGIDRATRRLLSLLIHSPTWKPLKTCFDHGRSKVWLGKLISKSCKRYKKLSSLSLLGVRDTITSSGTLWRHSTSLPPGATGHAVSVKQERWSNSSQAPL